MRKGVKDYILYKYIQYMIKKMNQSKKKSKLQKGGDLGGATKNVISATLDIFSSMNNLGKSIFTEINEITNIPSQLNSATSSSKGVPNQINGPPPFTAPTMPYTPS